MKVSLLFVFIFFIELSCSQLYNRQNQNAIHSLSYSPMDFDSQIIPVTQSTTTSTTVESTTKKKGFFSGISNFFKGGSKDQTTTSSTTSTTTKKPIVTSTSTIKAVPQSSTMTSFTTTIKAIPQSSTITTSTTRPSTSKPPSRDDFSALPTQKTSPPTSTTQRIQSSTKATPKDDFPPLPTQSGRPQQQPTEPAFPNAWNVRPQISTDKPATFFPHLSSTTTSTRRPAQASQTPTATTESSKVTDAELLSLSEALFSKDINNGFKFVTVNYQGRTQSSATTDEAAQPLLQIDEKLNAVSTVEKMKVMFNNYEQDTSINEYVSPIERTEENDFIDAVLSTPVMKHTMNFLKEKEIVTADPATHKELLKTLWFGMYSRGGGKISSSGFEHVFLSEVKNGTVLGLHNWIYLSEEEKERDLDYKGWLKKIDLGNKGQIAKVRFALNGIMKPSNSLFIGTSPELELALYTVCFELRADQDCRLAYGGKDFNIVTHTFRYRGKNLIGSAYPEI